MLISFQGSAIVELCLEKCFAALALCDGEGIKQSVSQNNYIVSDVTTTATPALYITITASPAVYITITTNNNDNNKYNYDLL